MGPSRHRDEGAPRLPAAEQEAARVAAIYGAQGRLLGADALAGETLLAEMGRHGVVHFAGHSIVNRQFPGLSFLAIGGGEGGAESLYAYQVAQAAFTDTALVVLASCSSIDGLAARGEGVLSLARPFLAAGAHGVVGTLWPVHDAESSRLFVALHRYLAAGDSPARALQRAQIEQIRESGNAFDDWAAATAIGEAAYLIH